MSDSFFKNVLNSTFQRKIIIKKAFHGVPHNIDLHGFVRITLW